MTMKCKICSHEDRAAVEAAIRNPGSTLRSVGAQFGVTPSSVHRHKDLHMSTIQRTRSVRPAPTFTKCQAIKPHEFAKKCNAETSNGEPYCSDKCWHRMATRQRSGTGRLLPGYTRKDLPEYMRKAEQAVKEVIAEQDAKRPSKYLRLKNAILKANEEFEVDGLPNPAKLKDLMEWVEQAGAALGSEDVAEMPVHAISWFESIADLVGLAKQLDPFLEAAWKKLARRVADLIDERDRLQQEARELRTQNKDLEALLDTATTPDPKET